MIEIGDICILQACSDKYAGAKVRILELPHDDEPLYVVAMQIARAKPEQLRKREAVCSWEDCAWRPMS